MPEQSRPFPQDTGSTRTAQFAPPTLQSPSSQDYTIALLAPYGSLCSIFSQAAQDKPCRLVMKTGMALEEAVDEARRIIKTDAPDVICSRGGTADYLKSQLDVPVVDISTTALDLLRTLLPFSKKLGKVAFFHYLTPMPEVQTVAKALGMEIREYFFHTREEMKARMLQAAAEGVQLGVGGALVTGMRDICGVEGILLEAGEDAVARSLNEALGIARVRRMDRQRHASLVTILDTVTEGIIATDSSNRLTLVNPAAAKLLDISPENALGLDARSVVPNTRTLEVLRKGQPELNEIQDLKGLTIVTNRVPIRSNGNILGVVCTFSGAERIRQAERRLRQKKDAFRARWRMDDILTHDAAMEDLKSLAQRYARTDATVLLLGESGTGKELFAQGMHLASGRRDGPFVPVNCAAIPEDLLESELFGYEEGAFTGARRSGKPGMFEMAHDGTIFLDEIGELPLHLQARLLRVLQEREVMHVGGDETVRINARVICATNRDLAGEVAEGRFREDLYYRCNVLQIAIPPLRARGEDVLHLARTFLERHPAGRRPDAASVMVEAVRKELCGYSWPGNVRELESCMERLALSMELFPERSPQEHFACVFRPTVSAKGRPARNVGDVRPLRESLEEAEREILRRALARCAGDAARAAKLLGIGRTTLWRKLQKGGRDEQGSGEGAKYGS